MAAIGAFLAFQLYPEGGSRVRWTFHQMKGNLTKLQNVTHKLADMFCNDTEQCKNAIDQFFMIAQDVLEFAYFTHKLADMFCNDPEQCKNATDEFFMIAASLPQDVVLQFADLMSKFCESSKQQEGGEGNRKHTEAKRVAVGYSEVQFPGDPEKGEAVIKSLKFSGYDESSLCDHMEGIRRNMM